MPRVNVPPGMGNPGKLRRWLENELEPKLEDPQLVVHTFGATPDTAERIRHRLPYRPRQVQAVDSDRACLVYRDAATPPADRTHIWVKCDTASAVVTLRFA